MGKILQIHNEYLRPGGEDVVVAAEFELLKSHGQEVRQFIVRNHDVDTSSNWGKAKVSWNAVWGSKYKRELEKMLEEFKPDVAHVHNCFPLLSPSIFRLLHGHGCRVVATMHNYRLFCAGATLFRNGKVCTLCLSGSKLHAIQHACYRGSMPGTATVVASTTYHSLVHSWDHVDRFIVLSEFSSGIFAAHGIPEDKHVIKQNFVNPSPPDLQGRPRKNQIFFAGRVSVEKGVEHLLEGWEKAKLEDWKLVLAGDGPLREELMRKFKGIQGVEWLGHIPHAEILKICAESKWLIIPSKWYELTPLIGLEAMSVGTPLIVPDLGSMPSLVADGAGLVFAGQRQDSLRETLCRAAATNPNDWTTMSGAALRSATTTYSPENAYAQLMKAYGFQN